MMVKIVYSKCNWCILKGFDVIKTVYELVDNPSYFVINHDKLGHKNQK